MALGACEGAGARCTAWTGVFGHIDVTVCSVLLDGEHKVNREDEAHQIVQSSVSDRSAILGVRVPLSV